MKTKKVKKIKRGVKTQEIVIRVEQPTITSREIAEPIKDGGKYMIPKTWISDKQVIQMVQKTPAKYVHRRPAKGGGMWDYVDGGYIKKVLNFTFGWNWDFEIIKQETFGISEMWGQVITTGKLTVKDDAGHIIIKSDNGRSDVKYKRGTKIPMDLGNDFKSSATDCLKRCAVQLGIASDVYGKAEMRENGIEVKETDNLPTIQTKEPQGAKTSELKASVSKVELPNGQVIGPDGKPTYLCSKCDAPIEKVVADYSLKVYGKRLCRNCQPKKNG
jgi:hypothetical protein